MKRRELLRHLTSQNCELLREGGRHSIWINRETRRKSAVPRHSELQETICRDLGVREP
jgi:mRNA interferase HicA